MNQSTSNEMMMTMMMMMILLCAWFCSLSRFGSLHFIGPSLGVNECSHVSVSKNHTSSLLPCSSQIGVSSSSDVAICKCEAAVVCGILPCLSCDHSCPFRHWVYYCFLSQIHTHIWMKWLMTTNGYKFGIFLHSTSNTTIVEPTHQLDDGLYVDRNFRWRIR